MSKTRAVSLSEATFSKAAVKTKPLLLNVDLPFLLHLDGLTSSMRLGLFFDREESFQSYEMMIVKVMVELLQSRKNFSAEMMILKIIARDMSRRLNIIKKKRIMLS